MNLLQFILSNYQVVETEVVKLLLNDTKEEGDYKVETYSADVNGTEYIHIGIIKDDVTISSVDYGCDIGRLESFIRDAIVRYDTTRELIKSQENLDLPF